MKPLVYTQNMRLLKAKQPEPQRSGAATLIGFGFRHPCTVISVTEKNLLIQEDLVKPESISQNWICQRDMRGKLWGFVRRKGSNRWRPSGGELGFGVIIGERLYVQDDLAEMPL